MIKESHSIVWCVINQDVVRSGTNYITLYENMSQCSASTVH